MAQRRHIGIEIGNITELNFDPTDPSRVVVTMQTQPEIQLHTDAIATIEHCLNQPAVAALLRRPSPDAELWREQPALLRHDGKMISAMFDRVQIAPGREAVVIDYKTNVGEPEDLRGHYREQMCLYRTSVAKLCQLAEAKVRCVLIHVRTGTLVEV